MADGITNISSKFYFSQVILICYCFRAFWGPQFRIFVRISDLRPHFRFSVKFTLKTIIPNFDCFKEVSRFFEYVQRARINLIVHYWHSSVENRFRNFIVTSLYNSHLFKVLFILIYSSQKLKTNICGKNFMSKIAWTSKVHFSVGYFQHVCLFGNHLP